MAARGERLLKPIGTTELTEYYGDVRGIEEVTLQVEKGEIFGFIGPNEAGKTTTIRTLVELVFPTSGSARIFGLNTHSHSRDIKKKVGYLPSEDFYYRNMTAGELLILDEPTSGLDPLMQLRFFELRREQQEKGVTVFFSSHILSEVQKICSRVAIIRNGRILRTESIEALQKAARQESRARARAGLRSRKPGDPWDQGRGQGEQRSEVRLPG